MLIFFSIPWPVIYKDEDPSGNYSDTTWVTYSGVCVVLDSTVVSQRRRRAPLSEWLTVTQILKYNDCWQCFLLSLTLRETFSRIRLIFTFFLGVCVISPLPPTSIHIVLSFLRVYPWPKIEGDLVRGWIQAAVAELNRAHQSPRLQNVRGCVRREASRRGKVIGGW